MGDFVCVSSPKTHCASPTVGVDHRENLRGGGREEWIDDVEAQKQKKMGELF
jgi:hypothetical protein